MTELDQYLRILIWISYPIIIGIYALLLYRIFKRKRRRSIYRGFFKACVKIVQNTNTENAINEIRLNFRKLAEKNPNYKDVIKNPTDLLEELVYNIDRLEPNKFKELFGIEVSEEIRGKIIELITYLKKENPFVSLPPKEGNLLSILKQSIESNNKELGLNTINQLSDEIEILDSNLKIQERRNVNSYIVSVVGVILTIVFGIITLIQSFGK